MVQYIEGSEKPMHIAQSMYHAVKFGETVPPSLRFTLLHHVFEVEDTI